MAKVEVDEEDHIPSLYDVLEVREDASYAEIRSRYRSAVLAFHPDKALRHLSDGDSFPDELWQACIPPVDIPFSPKHELARSFAQKTSLERFLRVQEAWAVLHDSESRAAYDVQLWALRFNSPGIDKYVVVDDVCLEDMSVETAGEGQELAYQYPCRCGDFFTVAEDDLVTLGYLDQNAAGIIAATNVHSPGEASYKADRSSMNPIETELTVPGSQEDGQDYFRLQGVGNGQGNDQARFTPACERRLIVVPCGSCSLHIRLYFWAQSR